MKQEYFDYKHVGYGFLAVVAAALLCAGVTVVLAILDPRQFAFSYLFAYTFFFTISLGALFWMIVHHTVDAEWSVVVRRQLENIACLLLALAVLFVPLVFVAPQVWSWMQPAHANDVLLQEKAAYLNRPFFWSRSVVYFAVFVVAAYLLRGFSVAQDKTGAARYTVLSRRVSFGAAIPFALCLTFAVVDWLMGLDYKWFSTMWGVYLFAGAALSSLCVLVLVITALRRVGHLEGVVTLEHYHILSKLMLAFTIFWAYIAFSQYMLIWYSNIPEETVYFLIRNTEGWHALSTFLVIGHFFVPFLLLLPNAGKKKPAFLCGIAIWILLMHLLDIYLIVLPVLHPTGVRPSFLDGACVLTLGLILAAIFLKSLGDSALYPSRDPRLEKSLNLQN